MTVRLLALVLAAILVACSGTRTAEPEAETPDPPAALLFTCDGPPFSVDLFDVPAVAELGADPAAAGLREMLGGQQLEADFLPDHGWWLVERDAAHAWFIARSEHEANGEPGFAFVTMELGADGWRPAGWGGCRPRVHLEGLHDATWVLDPAEPAPGPADREFVALVTETACASGQSSEGRVRPPAILYGEAEVLVVFAIQPLPGDVFACPGNPATRVVVTLDEPLGDRRLMDGGVFPPHDPTLPWP